VNRTAKELLDNPKIAARLAELKAAHVERHEITVDDLIRELEEARSIAMSGERQQPAAMVAASMGKAKILGLVQDKVDARLTGPDGGPIEHSLRVTFVEPGRG
jgi:phage terminase small subunit